MKIWQYILIPLVIAKVSRTRRDSIAQNRYGNNRFQHFRAKYQLKQSSQYSLQVRGRKIFSIMEFPKI